MPDWAKGSPPVRILSAPGDGQATTVGPVTVDGAGSDRPVHATDRSSWQARPGRQPTQQAAAASTRRGERVSTAKATARRLGASRPGRLVRGTVAGCFRYRVTGLAAEAGFFALLSIPPLILGLVGSLGWLAGFFGTGTVNAVRDRIVSLSAEALSAQAVQQVIVPTLDEVLRGGRFDIVSVGFLFSLWSGSRAMNVIVDTITIMYGLSGHRGILVTRALSFTLYVVGVALGVVFVPLALLGPSLLQRNLPPGLDLLILLYWPLTLAVSVAFLTSLYHLSVPVRTPWLRDLPGAVLTLVVWAVGSVVLRVVLRESVGGTSIYGPLAAPIVILTWLYFLAVVVLIGAAFNAAVEQEWPSVGVEVARHEAATHPDRPLTPVSRVEPVVPLAQPVRGGDAGLGSRPAPAGPAAENPLTP